MTTLIITEVEDTTRLTWNTEDEVEFLFSLADKGKYDTLRDLRRIYNKRDWSQEGMNVDQSRIADMFRFILDSNPDLYRD